MSGPLYPPPGTRSDLTLRRGEQVLIQSGGHIPLDSSAFARSEDYQELFCVLGLPLTGVCSGVSSANLEIKPSAWLCFVHTPAS
jgi:hypothetical protein